MKSVKNITRLQQLADMKLQVELGHLKHAAAQRADTLSKIEGLHALPPLLESGQDATDAVTALRYLTWADTRRAELQSVLAGQTAAWLDQRDLAKEAFGKARGFEKIAAKLALKP